MTASKHYDVLETGAGKPQRHVGGHHAAFSRRRRRRRRWGRRRWRRSRGHGGLLLDQLDLLLHLLAGFDLDLDLLWLVAFEGHGDLVHARAELVDEG